MAEDDGGGTDDLLRDAGRGDGSAIRRLLERHRLRLKRMVAARLDRRLAPRVDPSDVVQEALADAGRLLPEYLRERPIPYYPWLRRLAFQRLVWWRRFHLGAGKRTVARDRSRGTPYPGESAAPLVDRLVADGTTPSGHAIRDEERGRILETLERLGNNDREILVLRYLQGLSFPEIADALGTSLGTVKMRHLRALERLRPLLEDPGGGAAP